ncbi:hypothetical protein FYZ44_11000 [Mobiluncus mulieris]|nr:hypothetical protein [Mobiluncus mulieris]
MSRQRAPVSRRSSTPRPREGGAAAQPPTTEATHPGKHLMKTRKTHGHLASRKKNPARQKHRSQAYPAAAFTLSKH